MCYFCVLRCLLKPWPTLLEIGRPLIKVRNSFIACSRGFLLRLPPLMSTECAAKLLLSCWHYRKLVDSRLRAVSYFSFESQQVDSIMLLLFRSLRVALRKEGRLLARSTLNQNGVSNTVISLSQNEVGHNNCIPKGNARLKIGPFLATASAMTSFPSSSKVGNGYKNGIKTKKKKKQKAVTVSKEWNIWKFLWWIKTFYFKTIFSLQQSQATSK